MTLMTKLRPLTLREKLALSLTSYGNVSRMARDIGITPYRLRSWLREGEPALIDPSTGDTLRRAGVKLIPDDVITKAAINEVFNAHKKRSKQVANFFDIPYSDKYPVFQFQKPRQNETKSDRTFVIGTEYLGDWLRARVIESLQETREYYSLVSRSVINLADYNKNTDKTRDSRFPINKTQKSYRDEIKQKIKSGQKYGVIYTGRIRMGPFVSDNTLDFPTPSEVIQDLDYFLNAKHKPATGEEGSALADQLVFQLIPQGFYGFTKTEIKRGFKK